MEAKVPVQQEVAAGEETEVAVDEVFSEEAYKKDEVEVEVVAQTDLLYDRYVYIFTWLCLINIFFE